MFLVEEFNRIKVIISLILNRVERIESCCINMYNSTEDHMAYHQTKSVRLASVLLTIVASGHEWETVLSELGANRTAGL